MIACDVQINGVVQGVGFRPFVYGLAARFGLSGAIRNESAGVSIALEGDATAVQRFLHELSSNPPPLARLEQICCKPTEPRRRHGFEIAPSRSTATSPVVFIAPDVAICGECLKELFDPRNRRFGYAFLSCTQCGPRLTTIESLPYDRTRTAWRRFPICSECQGEYEDPNSRRFHDQSISCPRCGPRLTVLGPGGIPVDAPAGALSAAVATLRDGKIAAIKGLGGFHLACDAGNEGVVAELRLRKKRNAKPFAVMFENLHDVERTCVITAAEADLLVSSERPIVLLKKQTNHSSIATAVAPGNPSLGVMLPYTGLHYLLLRQFGRPLVMTSGNESEEPISYKTKDAITRLSGLADLFLTHDRPIQTQSDDSVLRVTGGKRLVLRRSRGYAPAAVRLPVSCRRNILALGGQLKATFALGRGENATLSHHIGDLDRYETFGEYARAIEHYERLFSFGADLFVHDLHPDYLSSRKALELAAERGKPSLAVQHHHAHLASCMAENGTRSPAIGVIFDGTGLGTDGTIWGGEFLLGDLHSFRRVAHLRRVPMPGGDQAIREPWRMAASYLRDGGEPTNAVNRRGDPKALSTIEQMLSKAVNCPLTSSCGRLLDAIASIIGLRDRTEFEGQPAIELEGLAMQSDDGAAYPFALSGDSPTEIDTRPMIAEVLREQSRGIALATIARRVHSTIVEIIVQTCQQLRSTYGVNSVVLSGGVFANGILAAGATERLRSSNFDVFTHSKVPPNDGGLCLGQVAIAAVADVS